jgi:hypothetical protein
MQANANLLANSNRIFDSQSASNSCPDAKRQSEWNLNPNSKSIGNAHGKVNANAKRNWSTNADAKGEVHGVPIHV